MTRKLNVRYFFRISVTHVSSTLPLTPPSVSPFLPNSDLRYGEQWIELYLGPSHYTFSNTAVCKWKLHVSVEKCLRASQHKSHPYRNYVLSLPTTCTGTIEYLRWLLNVCYMFRHSLCHPLITYKNHLLIVKLPYKVSVTEYELWVFVCLYIYIYIYIYIYMCVYVFVCGFVYSVFIVIKKYWPLAINNWQ
jgi:hypothetical protein